MQFTINSNECRLDRFASIALIKRDYIFSVDAVVRCAWAVSLLGDVRFSADEFLSRTAGWK